MGKEGITYSDLKKLDSWLVNNWSDYRAMIEGGSVAAGDPLIEGLSDWEIAIVADEITPEMLSSLGKYLKTFPQDDRVELVYRITKKLLAPSNDTHYLTGKYRSKTLFGENLIDKIPVPQKDIVEKAWEAGLNKSFNRINKYLVNASIWSDEKIRRQFRTVFKDIFMYLQMRAWCENGKFPVTRKDVVERYPSATLEETWSVLNKINDTGRENILDTAKKIGQLISSEFLPRPE